MLSIKEIIVKVDYQEIPLNLDYEYPNATLRFVKDHYEDLKNSILFETEQIDEDN